MQPPKPGYGKEYAVKWLGIDDETMYSGAMTKEAAEELWRNGHWHSRACPSVEHLRATAPPRRGKESNEVSTKNSG